jgi:hypothetical protein
MVVHVYLAVHRDGRRDSSGLGDNELRKALRVDCAQMPYID